MFNLVYIFFAGMGISFLGALPLGTLNITAMQVAIEENVRNAIKFSLGVALVEIGYVRLSLTGIDMILRHQRIFYFLEWLTVLLFLVLGISSLMAVRKKAATTKPVLLNNTINRFLLGAGMSAVNPVQIPFWFLWSAYLMSVHVLLPQPAYFNTYIAGIGLGTLAALAVFVFGGKWVMNKMGAGQRFLHILVAVVFLLSAIIQCYRVINNPLTKRLRTEQRP